MSWYVARVPSFTILKSIVALAFDRPISVQLTTPLSIVTRLRSSNDVLFAAYTQAIALA
jgi:hypothetical protein